MSKLNNETNVIIFFSLLFCNKKILNDV